MMVTMQLKLVLDDIREKLVNKPMKGQFDKAGVIFKKIRKRI